MRSLKAVFVLLLFCALFCGTSLAAENAVLHEAYADALCQLETDLQSMQSELQSKNSNDWTNVELEEYINTSLWYSFCGVVLYQNAEGRLPDSINEIYESGYISYIPQNPFSDWQSITLRIDDLEFHAGDLCMQRCNSAMGDPSRSRSFELSIFGPTPGFSAYGYSELNRHNADWATIPGGAVYQLGAAFKKATGTKPE